MPTSTSLTLPVGGMHCQNCVNSIQKTLSALPGVTGVEVSLDKGQAVVSGTELDVGAIRNAIEDLGFDAGHPIPA